MNASYHQRCDGVTRRDLLRVGGLTALGLGLGDFLSARQAVGGAKATAKNCVLIWLDGGPSHLETFDLKPDAPSEVRGPLKPIQTRLPGYLVSECLPLTASRLHKMTVIRSITSPLGEHNFGTHYMMTGYKPTPVIGYPTFQAVAYHQGRTQSTLPGYVAIPSHRVGGGRMTAHGYLPAHRGPFSIDADPGKPDFRVRDLDLYRGMDVARINRRREFLHQLDQFTAEREGAAAAAADPIFEQVHRLVTSPQAKQAFDLEDEPRDVRSRYGFKSIGQCCLLARRLLERGVPLVTVNNRGWDTHNDLYTRLKEGYTGAKKPVGLIPSLDLALTALVDDLEVRGLLDETLVVVMGEFGRTPKLNTAGGRDHWPRVFSVLLAGGGAPGGTIIGSSDATAEQPKDRPVTPSDLVATIYTLLGIDPDLELTTADGRPVRLTPRESAPIAEIVG